jgi:3-isopropylmalate dehydrogenase
MLLRHSLGLEVEAAAVENAVDKTFVDGHYTQDLAPRDQKFLSTREIGDVIVANLV